MLIQFAAQNVLSFRDKVILSALAAPGVTHDTHHVYADPDGLNLLRVLVLYGANASGKSNVVKALAWARRLVIDGTPAGQPIVTHPFKLDQATRDAPSTVEFEVLADGTRYSYGFVVSQERVEGEWLYLAQGDDEVMLFEREDGEIRLGEGLTANEERRRFIGFVAEGTRPNQLFLHETFDRAVHELNHVTEWFQDASFESTSPHDPTWPLGRFYQEDQLRTFASKLLHDAGTGVTNVEIELIRDTLTVVGTSTHQVKRLPVTEQQVVFVHNGEQTVHFRVGEESDGTLRLLTLSPLLYDMAQARVPVSVIDEIDSSLHTLLTRHIVQTVLAMDPSQPGQLIFTTHDTNLLDLNLLTADSVWLLEKDKAGASSLYSLAEFKADQLDQLTGQVERGYLQGRFGGIPFLGDPKRLGWVEGDA